MKRNIVRLLLASCLFAVACQKNNLTEEQANTTSQKKNSLMATAAETSAAASVNAYTNTSTYINAGFTFLNPTQVDKNRVPLAAVPTPRYTDLTFRKKTGYAESDGMKTTKLHRSGARRGLPVSPEMVCVIYW